MSAIFLFAMIFRGRVSSSLSDVCPGLGATLGHNFPFYLQFKGGKGIAVLAGLVVSTDLLLVPIPLAGFLIGGSFTRYVSVGSLLIFTYFSRRYYVFGHLGESWMGAPYLADILVPLLIRLAWYRHKANIDRLLSGTENNVQAEKEEKNKKEENMANSRCVRSGKLGNGTLGPAAENGHQVTVWSIDPRGSKDAVEKKESMQTKLPGVHICREIRDYRR